VSDTSPTPQRSEIVPLHLDAAKQRRKGKEEATDARMVGQHTDGEGIITEVRKASAMRPSMTLVGATFTVYSETASK
jgi:hypothetical protein